MKRSVFSIELHRARDAEESYAIRLAGEQSWRSRIGFGSQFEKVWNVEFQPAMEVDLELLDWDPVLDRAIEAFRMSDPIVTNFEATQGVS